MKKEDSTIAMMRRTAIEFAERQNRKIDLAEKMATLSEKLLESGDESVKRDLQKVLSEFRQVA